MAAIRTQIIPRLAGLCLVVTIATNSAFIDEYGEGVLKLLLGYGAGCGALAAMECVLRCVTWSLFLVGGIGLLLRQRWAFYLAYAAALLNYFPGYSFVPFVLPLAQLALPSQVAYVLVHFVANAGFILCLVWSHWALRRRPNKERTPLRSNRSLRYALLATGGVILVLWILTWTWGVNDVYSDPRFGNGSRQLPFDPLFMERHIGSDLPKAPWYYKNAFSPAPFLVGLDHGQVCELGGSTGRAYRLWFFGCQHELSDITYWNIDY